MALQGLEALATLQAMLLDNFRGVGEVADEGVGPWICTPLKYDGGHDATVRLLACQGVLLPSFIVGRSVVVSEG